jgi:hypothetical protein
MRKQCQAGPHSQRVPRRAPTRLHCAADDQSETKIHRGLRRCSRLRSAPPWQRREAGTDRTASTHARFRKSATTLCTLTYLRHIEGTARFALRRERHGLVARSRFQTNSRKDARWLAHRNLLSLTASGLQMSSVQRCHATPPVLVGCRPASHMKYVVLWPTTDAPHYPASY